jgi:hypothetical protein
MYTYYTVYPPPPQKKEREKKKKKEKKRKKEKINKKTPTKLILFIAEIKIHYLALAMFDRIFTQPSPY